MKVEGGCYCGEVRYEASGDPSLQGQCHCRECQYIAGGMPSVLLGMPEAGFRVTKGSAKSFTRSDIENPVTREFCPNCGTHLWTRTPMMPGVVMLKVGGLDDPSVFRPQMVIFTCDAQPFHQLPEGVPSFERLPGS
jgi:hypothetical protein